MHFLPLFQCCLEKSLKEWEKVTVVVELRNKGGENNRCSICIVLHCQAEAEVLAKEYSTMEHPLFPPPRFLCVTICVPLFQWSDFFWQPCTIDAQSFPAFPGIASAKRTLHFLHRIRKQLNVLFISLIRLVVW